MLSKISIWNYRLVTGGLMMFQLGMTSNSPQFRMGNGYDIHRLVVGRKLIIGGVLLNHPDNLGLDGIVMLMY